MGCEGVWALCVERVLYRGVPVHSRLFASSLGQAKAQPRAKYDDEFENHTRASALRAQIQHVETLHWQDLRQPGTRRRLLDSIRHSPMRQLDPRPLLFLRTFLSAVDPMILHDTPRVLHFACEAYRL